MGYKELGVRFKKLRNFYGYSRQQLADYLNLNKSEISLIENGERKINLTLMDKICTLFNCSYDYLTGESDEFTPSNNHLKCNDLNGIAKMNQIMSHIKYLKELDEKP